MSPNPRKGAGVDKRQDLIAWSMERVSEVHGDPTGVVYARLFAANPELERMFVLDTQGMARGAMLANVFDALLDMAGPRHYGLNLVLAECVNHEGIGVPPAIYATFFILVRDTMRDLLGAEWTPEVDAAWREVLSEIEAKLPA